MKTLIAAAILICMGAGMAMADDSLYAYYTVQQVRTHDYSTQYSEDGQAFAPTQ